MAAGPQHGRLPPAAGAARRRPDTGLPLLAGPPLTDPALREFAAARHEPLLLLRRLRDLYSPGAPHRPKWLQQNSAPVAAAYRQGRRRGHCPAGQLHDPGVILTGRYGCEWTRDPRGIRLRPCAGCDGTARLPLRLPEADGSVCTRCRTDRAGVCWPQQYDRYAHQP